MVNSAIIEKKAAIVAHIEDVAKNSSSIVAADYRGTSVTAMNALRADSRKMGVYVKIVKNTLVRRALATTQ